MEAGSNVAWTTQDEEGTFTYRGQVVSITNGQVLLNSEIGLISFPEDDGSLKPSREVAGLGSVTPLAPKAAKAHKPVKPGSKKARAIELYAALLPTLGDLDAKAQRLHVVAQFAEQLDMTTAGASTYYSMVK